MQHCKPTVLVIDDDASVRKALQRLIRAAGYSVEVFASADAYVLLGAIGRALDRSRLN
jgi:FixJ family two-component response regulator